MLHLTVGLLVILVGAAWLIGIAIGAAGKKRDAERLRMKLEIERLHQQARLERKETWRQRKDAVAKMLMPWRREGGRD